MELRRFEEIEAWKAARSLTHALYLITSHGRFGAGFRPERSNPTGVRLDHGQQGRRVR